MTRSWFRSLVWQYHDPGGVVLWWRVAPTRHLHIAAEMPFERLDESEVVQKIKERDRQLRVNPPFHATIRYTVGTPAIISTESKKPGFRGETIGDRLAHYGLVVVAADDDLLNGWKRVQSLLRLDPQGEPWLTIDPSCEQLSRAIPTGLRDEKHPDEVRTAAPALTALRYGAMSRPSPELTAAAVVDYPWGTMGYYFQQALKDGGARG